MKFIRLNDHRICPCSWFVWFVCTYFETWVSGGLLTRFLKSREIVWLGKYYKNYYYFGL